MVFIFVVALFGIAAVQASPTLSSKQSITSLTTNEINNYDTYTYFSKAAYCGHKVDSWKCGGACSNNSDFKIEAHGGDDTTTRHWYVGYAKNLKSVVVAYQGTNASQIKALTTDAHLAKGPLDSKLFPHMPAGVEVLKSFQEEHAKSAAQVLSAVQSAMSKYKTKTVTSVGHSLGAALATLNAAYLHGRLPSSTSFKTVTYGSPRVGNQKFADYVDANLHLTRITNKKDPIPIVPEKSLGFEHASGELHITDEGKWESCSGQENESKGCIDGEVTNIQKGAETDHDGPYNGITLGQCS